MPSTPALPPSNKNVSASTPTATEAFQALDAGTVSPVAAVQLINVATGDSNFGSQRPTSGMLFPRGVC
jgi:hypothetical protein